MKLSLQLYSARFATPYAEVIRRLGAMGYDAAEGYGGVFDEMPAIAEALSETGMTMPSLHVSLDLIEENPDRVAEIAGQVGATMIFAPHIGSDQRPADADGWRAFAARLAAAHEAMATRGLTFGWHNHDFEFHELPGGETPMGIILDEAPMIDWEADIAWIVRGGGDPLAWIEKYGSRISAAHFKDIAPEGEKTDEDGWADPATGTMDWPAIIDALRSHARVEVLVAEHDKPSDFERFATQAHAAWQNLKG